MLNATSVLKIVTCNLRSYYCVYVRIQALSFEFECRDSALHFSMKVYVLEYLMASESGSRSNKFLCTVIAIPLADGALISRSLARCKPWAAPAGGQGAAVL